MHDIGHVPFSHVGDEVVKKFTNESHEDRSLTLMKQHMPTEYAHMLEPIMKEQSGLGQILSLLDTYGYLFIDLWEANLEDELTIPPIPKLLGNHIFYTPNSEHLKVNEVGKDALAQLLNVRRREYRRLYTHPLSLILESMHKKAIDRLIETGRMTIEEFSQSTDNYIYGLILTNVYRDTKLAQLLGGFHIHPTFHSGGPYKVIDWFSPEDTQDLNHEQLERRVQNTLGLDTTDFVVVEPQDPDKTFTVINEQHELEEVEATNDRIFHEMHGMIMVCTHDGKVSDQPRGFSVKNL
jgi:HD superfamily phosphohydrolase